MRLVFRLFLCLTVASAVLVAFVAAQPHRPLSEILPKSTALYDDQHQLLRLTTATDERYRLWLSLSDYPQQFIDAVLLQEDEWFYRHFGVNPYGLLRGAVQTYILGNAPQGGSTISMQLARLLWRLDTKTIGGKLEQIARAVQLEIQYSKADILEAYLNYAPYGRNIEGAATAALIYFNKSPHQLTLVENLTLAVLPKNPNGYLKPQDRQINKALQQARNRLYKRWLVLHPQDRKWQNAFHLDYPFRAIEKLPFFAPHFVEQVLQQQGTLSHSASVIETSLSRRLQYRLEQLVRQYLQRRHSQGITNAAAILIDNRTMQVKALIGSGDYFNRAIEGQINGTSVKRSPASTLKPFIYALAFEQGKMHAETVLKDIPTAFNDYLPENYEGNFLGPISVTQALLQSRNIPAIDAAAQLKPDLYDWLTQVGIHLPKDKAHYGLTVALGGAELSMQQLATLYAMLANGGQWKPLQWRAKVRSEIGKNVLTPEAVFIVNDILVKNSRPDFTHKALNRLPVYWKTGTSNGLRDAWTAGFFGHYTLVVWLGNFNNQSNPHFIGRQLAAPLFLQIVDALVADEPMMENQINRQVPTKLKRLAVCAADGNLPNPWCAERKKVWFIAGVSPIKVSRIYQPVMIDNQTGMMACPPYDPKTSHQEIFEFWPTDLLQLFAQAGLAKRRPIRNPACPYAQQQQDLSAKLHEQPRIITPLADRVYSINARQSTITLSAAAIGNVEKLYWFANHRFLGESSANGQLGWQPELSGQYQITVIDELGRSTKIQIGVNIVR